ncbi:unnamed protein product, partial [Didymodactylos carnosus]
VLGHCCLCLKSFGILEDQLPCECIQKVLCGLQYCHQCIKSAKTHNDKKGFWCSYCDLKYNQNEYPEHSPILEDLLWNQYNVKYGIDQLDLSTVKEDKLKAESVLFDIQCRKIHIETLKPDITIKSTLSVPHNYVPSTNHDTSCIINDTELRASAPSITETTTLKAYIQNPVGVTVDSEQTKVSIIEANTLISTLIETEQQLIEMIAREDYSLLNKCVDNYRNVLSYPNRVGSKFVRLCESLVECRKKIEFEQYFPELHSKTVEWETVLGIGNEFQPKMLDIFKAVEKDLNAVAFNSVPCKIGLIGKTNAGKSSLLNRLRGKKQKIVRRNRRTARTTTGEIRNEETDYGFSPIRYEKSTYTTLNFEYTYRPVDSINSDLNDSYFNIDLNNGIKYMHKQTASWFLTENNNNLPFDRLKPVMETNRQE